MTTRIELKRVCITYRKHVVFTPTAEMFEDWDVEPTQEGFEEYVVQEFLDEMWWELSNKSANTPMDYVDLDTLNENIEFDWGEEDDC